ncbi:vinculin-like [Hyposmocoma kahamanoa]|uniref:vinculin-like n=1 Tax=Hyposmocoma kahamanoa TaxID=1477025 RepID=UPI000E6D635E|nr:vinculin-like [Hyposmocoma kahamanoa]
MMRAGSIEQVKEEESKLSTQVEELKQVLKEASNRAKGDVKRELTENGFRIDAFAKALHNTVHEPNVSMDKITTATMTLIDSVGGLNLIVDRPSVVPIVEEVSAETKALGDEVISNSKALLSKTQALVKEVKTRNDNGEDNKDEPMTWVMFSSGRTGVLEAFENLINILKRNGHRAGLVAAPEEEEEETQQKSYVQMQVEVANKWLQRRPSKPEIQANGEKATQIVIDIAEKMAEDLKDSEKEEMTQLITESKELFAECKKKYDSDNASALMDRLRELRTGVERGAVGRVVRDFGADAPLADLDVVVDAERDEAKRKFILERKIAELLAQLGRVKKTARFVADAARPGPAIAQELDKSMRQTELLAPLLVKAAEERVAKPDDAAVVENYKKLLAQYSESMSRVRDLCDQSVDPMDFVQTAGEAISRMKEETSKLNDPQKCAYTSNAITR